MLPTARRAHAWREWDNNNNSWVVVWLSYEGFKVYLLKAPDPPSGPKANYEPRHGGGLDCGSHLYNAST